MVNMEGLDLEKLTDNYVGSVMISGIPMPPSDNHQYRTVVRRMRDTGKYKAIRVSSDSQRKYKKQFNDWALMNMETIQKARSAIKSWNGFMDIRFYFAIHEESLITKQNGVRKLDAGNRDKSLTDLLSAALLIDDKIFASTLQEKVIAAPNGEQVMVIIRPAKLRTLSEVYEGLELKLL